MIKNILGIFTLLVIIFDFFMITPFGIYWTMKNLDEGKSCYGFIIMIITIIPTMIILDFLKML